MGKTKKEGLEEERKEGRRKGSTRMEGGWNEERRRKVRIRKEGMKE
jgi:hypothetical protein